MLIEVVVIYLQNTFAKYVYIYPAFNFFGCRSSIFNNNRSPLKRQMRMNIL